MTGWDDETVETFSPQRAEQVVAEFAEMADLSAFHSDMSRLLRLLDAMDHLTDVPPHMSSYTLDQLHNASEMVRYVKVYGVSVDDYHYY